MRITKSRNEYVFSEDDGFTAKFGSALTEIEPKVVYLRMKGKVTPIEKKQSYAKQIALVKKEFEDYAVREVKNDEELADDFIFTLELSEKNAAFKKVSFLRYDLFVKPKAPRNIDEYSSKFAGYAERFNKKLRETLSLNGLQCR